MSTQQEIKCPGCNEWTFFNGHIDDRCLHCNAFLIPDVLPDEAEKKMADEISTQSDPLFIKPTDNNTIARVKLLLQYFRALATYTQLAFFAFITFILFILGIIAA